MIRQERKLVLETGDEFYGIGFGSDAQKVYEVVFNTSVVGYQEIISDPCYAEQIVVMTYPLVGNYGITDEDFESRINHIGGLVVRECCDTPSNFRYTKTLEELLDEWDIPCLSGVDTRSLTKKIRQVGRPMGIIVPASMPVSEALEIIRNTPKAGNLVAQVSCRKRWISRTPNHVFHVVVIDCGIKTSVVRALNKRGCNVTIVPYNTPSQAIRSFNPDGILISNGPGDVMTNPEVAALFDELKGQCPIFGIGLGMEIIAKQYGAEFEKLGAGVHGDRPIRDIESNRINIGVMNHSWAVTSVDGTGLKPTHTMVPENSVVGFKDDANMIYAVQFNPESAPGPDDNEYIFNNFIKLMEEHTNA